jgi:hypothetical protein
MSLHRLTKYPAPVAERQNAGGASGFVTPVLEATAVVADVVRTQSFVIFRPAAPTSGFASPPIS